MVAHVDSPVHCHVATPLGGEGRARRRRAGRWGPVAISLGVHGAVLLVAAFWFAAVQLSAPSPHSLQVAAMEFMDFETTEDPSALEVAPPELPPAELEVDIPEAFLLSDLSSEECELPACDFGSPEQQPVELLDVPLSAARQSRPRPTAPLPTSQAPTSQPRAVVRRPVVRPAKRVARPATGSHRRTGRALKLVHRPNLMQYYPAEARRRGIEGEALVEIRVDRRGVVVEARIIRSSGSALLDRQAIRLMYDYRFAAGDGGRSRVPVNFRLR